MRKNLSLYSSLLLLVLFSSFGAAPTQAGYLLEKASSQTLVLKNDQTQKTETLRTEAPNPQFLTVLTDPESQTPYVLYESEKTSLYLQRLDGKGKATTLVYPGRITDPKKGVVYEGRTFYGNCLPKVKSGVVSHVRELVDRRGMQKSVFIAEPGPQYAYEALLERRLPNLRTTLDLVKRKVCFEIPGRARNSLAKILSPKAKPELEDEEESEEEEKTKESTAETPPDAPTAGKD